MPATEAKNSLAAFALKLFEDKQRYKENGGPIYRFYKQKVNSFIGCFAQKNRSILHLSRWDDTHGRYDKETTVKKFPRYDIFQIITAMARRYISELMNKAVEAGCRILKVNTDGFITDKPIPESMLGEGLGDLRFEGKLTNLIIFSGNRHVADGEQSISGLPESMYIPGVYNYVYYQVVWSGVDKTFILKEANVNLLDEMEDFLNEER